ncbi:hypothetical protein [Streptomyces xanthochromogenes]|uniref:hypothetical protein n=1 Tax=Streptomyces xanthochromogenes TaxID=67384 RepID=UPI0016775AD4|nr:hypothetical protein [Streptomyces xanthochromogenes]
MRPSLLRGPLRSGIAPETRFDLRERPLGALGGAAAGVTALAAVLAARLPADTRAASVPATKGRQLVAA